MGLWHPGRQRSIPLRRLPSVGPVASRRRGSPVVAGCTGAAYAAAAFANSRADVHRRRATTSRPTTRCRRRLRPGRLPAVSKASLERENFSHTYRERDKTWEDKLKLTYVDRSLGDATLRASYEQDRKRGSFYDPLVNSRGGLNWFADLRHSLQPGGAAEPDRQRRRGRQRRHQPGGRLHHCGRSGTRRLGSELADAWRGNFNSGGLMKTDQADRDQSIFNARLNYMARPDLDIGAMVQVTQGAAIRPTSSRRRRTRSTRSTSTSTTSRPRHPDLRLRLATGRPPEAEGELQLRRIQART